MAFDKRLKELLDALAELELEPKKAETIRRGLETYARAREGRLHNLLELLEPGKKPNLKVWLDKAMAAIRDAHDTFAKLDEGNAWLAGVATQEHAFFFRIYRLGAVAHRDRMVAQTLALEQAMKEFDSKWAKIRDSDKKLDERLKKTAEEYSKMLVEAARCASATEKQAHERMLDTFEKALNLGLRAVQLGLVGKVLQLGTKTIKACLDQTKARRLEIHALLSREEQVFTTFKETREMVAEFLEDNGYPQIKDALDDGEDAIEALAKGMVTDAQKADAAEFAAEARDELRKVFSAAERQYKDFARKHEHLFFGPLGGSYMQELAENDDWKRVSRSWQDQRRDFDDLLRERTLAASDRKILEVSLDGLDEESRREIYKALHASCADLLKAWNAWKDFTKEPEWILKSREDTQSILRALR
ncbi:MAG: hypothetical protein R3A79_08170 [Nannocystaceae bacterium]